MGKKRNTINYYIGNSPYAKKVNRAIRKFAKVDKNILIVGEPGTGRKYAAQKIHELSARRNRPFVVINCASLGHTIGKKEFKKETSLESKKSSNMPI